MANNISYISLVISLFILSIGSILYFYIKLSGNEFNNLNVDTIKITEANIDNLNITNIVEFENIDGLENLSSTNIFSRFINTINSLMNSIKSDSLKIKKTIETENFTNYTIISTNSSIITGSIYYTLYNSASMIYQDDNSIKLNNCTCTSSNLKDCGNCMKVNYINKSTCPYPYFFGSSPITYISDIWEGTDLTTEYGFVCLGLGECNQERNNIFNKNSLNWRTIIIYDNKPMVDINPYYMALYLTNLYISPINLFTDDQKTYYQRILYNTFVYNASNFSDFENTTNGSSYLYGSQDYGPNPSLFYNPFGIYGTYDGQFFGPQNGCIYSCSGCNINPPCNKIYDINGFKDKNCTCYIPYVSNSSNKGQKLDTNLDNKSANKILSVVKYLPKSTDVSQYDYTYNNGFTTNPNGVKITIKHKNYPNKYQSDKFNNFGAMHKNTHSSLSSYKDSNGNNDEICGTGTSSINPFDFGECEITLDYTYKNLTKIPIVEATLSSDIRYQFQAGYGFSCAVKSVSTTQAIIVLRNFPMDNLVSSSALTGFLLNYKIYI